MIVLGIETSCDETAAAVVDASGVLADVVHTQEVHVRFGGVVPELASRAHLLKVGPVVQAALKEAGIERPDAVAVTAGPGLIGAVLVGLCFGKSLAAGWGVPFVGINHLEGHLLSVMLENPAPKWPFLGLVVSGGHTTLYHCRGLGDYEILGETIDDAAGEAFDKVARLMGLGYPGGPVVDRLANAGNPTAVALPRPMPKSMDFSFSGLKTAVRTHVYKAGRASDADVCASFQAAVVDTLLLRITRAAEATGVRRICLAGGVAANSSLRAAVQELPGFEAFLPQIKHCTDNAAMIANAGRMRLISGQRDGLETSARAAWSLEN